MVRLAPHGLRLWLHPGDRVEYHDAAVQYPQAALDLCREVDVPGGIDDVDREFLPLARGGSGRDRDAAFLLLGHPVHRRRALVDPADLVDATGEEQGRAR